MKLVRHLLSHLLLLTLIIALVLAYYYRALVFSEDLNRQIDYRVQSILVLTGFSAKPAILPESVASKVKECNEEKLPTEQTTSTGVDNSTPTKAVLIEEVLVTDEDIKPDAESIVTEETDADVTAEKIKIKPETIESLIVQYSVTAEVSDERDTTVNVEVVEEVTIPEPAAVITDVNPETMVDKTEMVNENILVENKVESAEVAVAEEVSSGELVTIIAESNVVPDYRETEQIPGNAAAKENSNTEGKSQFGLINQARLAYQAGKVNKAIGQYLELIEHYPEDPNAHGELGNVYYSKGMWRLASLAYYEAAIQLMQSENKQQLHHLHRVIQGLDPEIANKLLEKVEQ